MTNGFSTFKQLVFCAGHFSKLGTYVKYIFKKKWPHRLLDLKKNRKNIECHYPRTPSEFMFQMSLSHFGSGGFINFMTSALFGGTSWTQI